MRDPFAALIERARNTPRPERVQGTLPPQPVSAKQVRATAREHERTLLELAAAGLASRGQSATPAQVLDTAKSTAEALRARRNEDNNA